MKKVIVFVVFVYLSMFSFIFYKHNKLLDDIKEHSHDHELIEIGHKTFMIMESDGRNHIYVDLTTGVQYIYLNTGPRRGGLTVIVDADGKPILYDGEY